MGHALLAEHLDEDSPALHHPLVGQLTITQQTLRSVQTPEQSLITCTAVAGSPAQEALTLLRRLTVGPDVQAQGAGQTIRRR